MNLVTCYKSLICSMSVDNWAYLSLVCLLVSLFALTIYLFVEKELLLKLSRFVLPIFFIFFIICTLFAIQQDYLLKSASHGIIMSTSSIVRKTPDVKSPEAFVLHEGSKVRITDDSMSQWTEITLTDGRQGWVKSSDIEAI